MIRTIKSYIGTKGLLTADKPVIVGFSGGSDSVSLLFILNRLGYKCIAAHCNFHLREGESDRDEIFCRQFAGQLGCPFEIIDFDTRAYAAGHHLSIEMAARELRYSWFETLRQKYDAQAIAVAHHRDDSNETMLMNMIRGTGIRGLCGIRPQNGWIVRPLLCVGKEEINRFIAAKSLSFVDDSTNQSDEFTRNIIRMRLIPLMKEINPSIESALERTAAHLSDVETIYLHTIENAKKKLLENSGTAHPTDIETTHQHTAKNSGAAHDFIRISIDGLSGLPAPKTILYELIRPFGFTRQQASSIFHSLPGESGKQFDAPESDYHLLKDRACLFIYKKPENNSETYLIDENDKDLSDLPIPLSISKVQIDSSFVIDKSPLTATFDYEKIHFPLILRKWRTGDRFIPFGMKTHKKLSDYFTDHKFSIYRKNKTWLLCSENDIIWIVGERIDNRFRIDNHTKFALIIKFFAK